MPSPNTHPYKISIFGSCVTRDILNFDAENKFSLKTYIARQSVISSVAPPSNSQITEDDIKLDSAFQRREVLADIQKTAFSQFKNDDSDFLIIDLIDERLGLVNWQDSIITHSAELSNSGLLDGDEHRIRYTTDANGQLLADDESILESFEVFCRRITEIYDQKNIIIHFADAKTKYVDKNGKTVDFPNDRRKNSEIINEIYKAMYDLLAKYLPDAKRIDIRKKYVAAENHRWGLATIHYEEDYYKEAYQLLLNCIEESIAESEASGNNSAVAQNVYKELVVSYKDEQILSNQYFKLKGYSFSVCDNQLVFNIDLDEYKKLYFAFYVSRNKKLIHKANYSRDKKFVFPIQANGSYDIMFFIKTTNDDRTVKKSDTLIVD